MVWGGHAGTSGSSKQAEAGWGEPRADLARRQGARGPTPLPSQSGEMTAISCAFPCFPDTVLPLAQTSKHLGPTLCRPSGLGPYEAPVRPEKRPSVCW